MSSYTIPEGLTKEQQDALESYFNTQKRLFRGVSFKRAVEIFENINKEKDALILREQKILNLLTKNDSFFSEKQ